MGRKIRYFLIIALLLSVAMAAPVVLFSLEDRLQSRTVNTENRQIVESTLLTENYIASDPLRVATWLYQVSQGTDYQVKELDVVWQEEDIYDLISLGAETNEFLWEVYDIFADSHGRSGTYSYKQYAVCNSRDYSDIIFMPLLLACQPYGISGYSFLLDSQTGALYAVSVTDQSYNDEIYELVHLQVGSTGFREYTGRYYDSPLQEIDVYLYAAGLSYAASAFEALGIDLYSLGYWDGDDTNAESVELYDREEILAREEETSDPDALIRYSQRTETDCFSFWISLPPDEQPEGADVSLDVVYQVRNTGAHSSMYFYGLKEFGELFPDLGYTPILEYSYEEE